MRFVLTIILMLIDVSMAFATEADPIAFLGSIVTPFIILGQIVLYPILILANSTKYWTIVALGMVSILWAIISQNFCSGLLSHIFLYVPIVMFLLACLAKAKITSKNIKNAQ